MKLNDPIRLELQSLVTNNSQLCSNKVLYKALFEIDSKYWIYEVSKSDILKSILNNEFSNSESDWIYLIIEKSNPLFIEKPIIHCITSKNASNFDLNTLYRKEYRYLYKIALFKGFEGLNNNEGKRYMRILNDKAFQSYLQYGIFNIRIENSKLYVNDLEVTTYGFPKLSERNIDIVKLRLGTKKVPYEKIGQQYNLTKQRVAQIYNSTILAIKYRYFYYLTKMKGGM